MTHHHLPSLAVRSLTRGHGVGDGEGERHHHRDHGRHAHRRGHHHHHHHHGGASSSDPPESEPSIHNLGDAPSPSAGVDVVSAASSGAAAAAAVAATPPQSSPGGVPSSPRRRSRAAGAVGVGGGGGRTSSSSPPSTGGRRRRLRRHRHQQQKQQQQHQGGGWPSPPRRGRRSRASDPDPDTDLDLLHQGMPPPVTSPPDPSEAASARPPRSPYEDASPAAWGGAVVAAPSPGARGPATPSRFEDGGNGERKEEEEKREIEGGWEEGEGGGEGEGGAVSSSIFSPSSPPTRPSPLRSPMPRDEAALETSLSPGDSAAGTLSPPPPVADEESPPYYTPDGDGRAPPLTASDPPPSPRVRWAPLTPRVADGPHGEGGGDDGGSRGGGGGGGDDAFGAEPPVRLPRRDPPARAKRDPGGGGGEDRPPRPRWCPPRPPRPSKPSWSRVANFAVRNAPCFWCSGGFEASATDRAILVRLNVLCAVSAAVQVGVGVFLFVVQWTGRGTAEEEHMQRQSLTPNLWTLNGMMFFLALVGVALVVIELVTLRVIRNVNLAGAVRYMWALYWVMPLEILLVISLFDYHRVTDVWVKHWWATPSMDWFRDVFCLAGTARTRCAAPIDGGALYGTELEWCEAQHNATDCSDVRDDAQARMTAAAYAFFTVNGVWGVLLIVLLFLALTLLEGIITAPIVQSSKEANVPAWLTLPIIGCLFLGSVLLFSPSSALSGESASNIFWIGITYMASGGTFFLAALLGWFISAFSVLNNRDKRHKQIAILLFIITMSLTVLSVAAVFSASLVYSSWVVDVDFDDERRGRIACYLDTAQSCTNCPWPGSEPDLEERRCPEWTTDEVVKVLQTQLKQSATLGAILLIYAFSALRFGLVLRSHFSLYQIDYV